MSSPAEKEAARQRALVAKRFKPDPRMERLIELRERDPQGFRSLVTGITRSTLGYYEKDKAVAKAEGVDVSYTPPKGTRWDQTEPEPEDEQ